MTKFCIMYLWRTPAPNLSLCTKCIVSASTGMLLSDCCECCWISSTLYFFIWKTFWMIFSPKCCLCLKYCWLRVGLVGWISVLELFLSAFSFFLSSVEVCLVFEFWKSSVPSRFDKESSTEAACSMSYVSEALSPSFRVLYTATLFSQIQKLLYTCLWNDF